MYHQGIYKLVIHYPFLWWRKVCKNDYTHLKLVLQHSPSFLWTSAILGCFTSCENWAVVYPSWRRSLSYRNQSIDLHSKSMDWFLNDRDIRHERVNTAAEMTSNEAGNNGFVDSDNLCLSFVLTSNVHYNSRSIIEAYSEPCQTKKDGIICDNS